MTPKEVYNDLRWWISCYPDLAKNTDIISTILRYVNLFNKLGYPPRGVSAGDAEVVSLYWRCNRPYYIRVDFYEDLERIVDFFVMNHDNDAHELVEISFDEEAQIPELFLSHLEFIQK